jgi:hypothetical protein
MGSKKEGRRRCEVDPDVEEGPYKVKKRPYKVKNTNSGTRNQKKKRNIRVDQGQRGEVLRIEKLNRDSTGS